MRDPRPFLVLVAGILGASLLAACGDGPTPPGEETRTDDALHFLRPAADAPPIANPVVNFYARKGTDREVFIYYRPRAGETDSLEFVRFRVAGETLLSRPDGSLFLPGDSVLITVRVVDPARLILEFEPSGLRFTPTKPAELEISFEETDDDRDGDGDVDVEDLQVERLLSIWRREAAGLPWVRLASVVELEVDKVKTDLFGFSGYAIAF